MFPDQRVRLPFGAVDGDPQRARTTFFVCLVAGMFDLIALDFWIGPRALASPPTGVATTTAPVPSPRPPPTSTPTPTPTHTAATKPPPSASAAAVSDPNHFTGVVARFEFEKADADLTQLRILAKQMIADPSKDVVLEGHADPSGNEYRNLSLSLDRAIWAKERLVELGVQPQRIRTVALGSARPLAQNVEDAGSINRRVEVRWVLKGQQ